MRQHQVILKLQLKQQRALNGLRKEEERFMENMETIDLKTLTKKELTTLLQKKIFQLGVNGLQQKDILSVIDAVEKELARRKEENISQANTSAEDANTEADTMPSEVESGN